MAVGSWGSSILERASYQEIQIGRVVGGTSLEEVEVGTFVGVVADTQKGTHHRATASGTPHRDCHNFEQGTPRGNFAGYFVGYLTMLQLDYHRFLALRLK